MSDITTSNSIPVAPAWLEGHDLNDDVNPSLTIVDAINRFLRIARGLAKAVEKIGEAAENEATSEAVATLGESIGHHCDDMHAWVEAWADTNIQQPAGDSEVGA